METMKTIIDFEAYDKIVNLLQSFYLQGFEDASNCSEAKDMSEDIKKQLDIAGINVPEEEFEYDPRYCPPNLDTIEYVLASTSYMGNETYLFQANANGEVTNWGHIGASAERWGQEDWRDIDIVMEETFGDQAKHFKKVREMWGAGPQYLFQRIKGDE